MLFTGAVYHAVPWQFIAAEAQRRDLTAPGLLGYLLPPAWTVLIVSGAAVALIKDLPAMLLGGVAPDVRLGRGRHLSAPRSRPCIRASARRTWRSSRAPAWPRSGIIGSHLAGDFFLGVDILVTSMLVNFLLMAVSVLTLPAAQPRARARGHRAAGPRAAQVPLALAAIVVLAGFLAVHTWRDLTAPAAAWYFRSTPVWLLVMAIGLAHLLPRNAEAAPRRASTSRRASRRFLPDSTR